MSEKKKTSVEPNVTANRQEDDLARNDFQPLSSNFVQRARHAPTRLVPTDVMLLQRTVGNAAVARLLSGPDHGAVKVMPAARTGVQAKLTVGPSSDKVEQEADRVAERVSKHDSAIVQPDGISKAGKSQQTPLIQRKLDWRQTNWSSAQYLDASKDGSGGVLFVGEERASEVVVKPGEPTNLEAAMAAMLINDTTQGKSDFLQAPGVRIVTSKEAAQIKLALQPLVVQAGSKEQNADDVQFKKERVAKLVAKLSDPGTIVQDVAVGQTFSEITPSINKHTEKKTFGGRKFRKESPLRIFKDKRSIEALGKATTVDVFTGNKDRLLGVAGGIGRGNFMVSPTTIRFIDNIWTGSDASFFKDSTIQYSATKSYEMTAKGGLEKWKKDPTAIALAKGTYSAITDRVWNSIQFNAANETRDKDKNSLAKTMAPYKDRFTKYFTLGLSRGKASLIVSLNATMQHPERFTDLVPGAKDDEVKQLLATMRARKEFLEGNTAIVI